MNLKYRIIFGFITGFLLGNTVRTHIKLAKAEAQILDLKARNAAVEDMKELYRGYAWKADRQIDSLTQVIKTLK